MEKPRPSVADKRRAFRRLHESGCFVIPNTWDPGSARYLQSLGFKAARHHQRRIRLVEGARRQRRDARHDDRAPAEMVWH
jgi:hypothetical protein